MRQVILVAHNLRSTHNVGSLLRTADGLGVQQVYLTGYTPYPLQPKDDRLPHLAHKIDKQITKTALGAEKSVVWKQSAEVESVIEQLKQDGFAIVALEQTEHSVRLPDFQPPHKLALIVGREVEGIESELLSLCDQAVEIPMLGQKESYNVVQAAAMALYHCHFFKPDMLQ